MKRDSMVGDLIVVVLAMWLFLAPWIVGFTNMTAAACVAWVGAIAVGGIAVTALRNPKTWKEWANLALGLALIAAPWIVHVTGQQKVEDALFQTGVVVAVVAILEIGVLRKTVEEPNSA